jgi:hypothetical protein
MRNFLVCKKGRGTRREMLGMFAVRDKGHLIEEISKTMRPDGCLVMETGGAWSINLVGRINPNQKKAFFSGAYLCDATVEAACDPKRWREISEVE